MEKWNYFWKRNATENPRVCGCIHAYAYTHSSHAYACLWHAHTCMGMRMQLGFQKLCKESFLHLILVWDESNIVWKLPQTLIFRQYKAIKSTFFKRRMKIVENTHKIHWKIMNQRGCFSQNILESNFAWSRPFLILIFKF